MPSPPAAVSSVHHCVAAATESGSVVSTSTPPGRRDERRRRRRPAGRRARGARRAAGPGTSAPSAASTWNGASRTPSSPARRPAVAPVRGGERLGVGRAGPGPRRAASPTSSPAAAACAERGDRGRQRRARRRADRRVLVAHQLLGLRAPRQQLGVEQQPRRVELVEQPGRLGGRGQPRRRASSSASESKNGAAGARPHRTGRVAGRAEPRARRVERAAHEHDRARAHVLLLAHDRVDALGAVGVERLVRVLEQVRAGSTSPPGSSSAAGRAASAGRSRTGSSPRARPRRSPRARRCASRYAVSMHPPAEHVGDVEHLRVAHSRLRRRPGPARTAWPARSTPARPGRTRSRARDSAAR